MVEVVPGGRFAHLATTKAEKAGGTPRTYDDEHLAWPTLESPA